MLVGIEKNIKHRDPETNSSTSSNVFIESTAKTLPIHFFLPSRIFSSLVDQCTGSSFYSLLVSFVELLYLLACLFILASQKEEENSTASQFNNKGEEGCHAMAVVIVV